MEYVYVNLINFSAILLKGLLFTEAGNTDGRFTGRTLAVLVVLVNSLLFPIFYRYVIQRNPRIFLFSVYALLSGITALLIMGRQG